MKKEDRLGLRTWIEIDKKAIAYNYKVFRSLISKRTKLMGVVKSNAYGHNLIEFAQKLQKLGADYLAVDSVVEGVALRKEGIKIPILVLGYTLPEMIEIACANDLEITISNFDYFKVINELNLKKSFDKTQDLRPVKVHIKVDTGMHRHGFQEGDMKKVLEQIAELKHNRPGSHHLPLRTRYSSLEKEESRRKPSVTIVGLYTHFASAKNLAFPKDTNKQIEIFEKWRKAFEKAKIKVVCHACATSGTILYPEAHYNMVRVGIGLYGIWPSRETEAFMEGKLKLKTVLSWKTIIGEINNIKAGERVGYDFTNKLERDSKVAVLPIGYWHGFPRALSNIGKVLINGKYAKVLGRVCMDIIMVDVTDIKSIDKTQDLRDAKVGDEVTIIGSDGKEVVTVDDTSTLLDASSYELVTRINPLIRRIFK